MSDLGSNRLFVAGLMLVLIHSNGGRDACLADPLSSVPKPTNEVNSAADIGMTNLIKFIQNDKERAASIGFYSADEVTIDKMKRGSGIPVLRIVDESLLNKPDFKNMSEYLEPLVDQFIYPITVDGKARAVINVKNLKKAKKWKAVSYGAPGLVSALEELKLLEADGVFIARYSPLGIWLACTDLEDKSQCHQITANPKALDYKNKYKIWPNREPVKGEPIGEAEAARAGAEAEVGRAESARPRVDPDFRRAEPPEARAETEVGRDKKEETPLVIIGKDQNGPTVLRGLADMAKRRKPFDLDDKTSRLNHP